MYQLNNIIIYFLIGMNILSFILFFVDKRLAIHHKYRISEHTLLMSCALGGSIGAILAMNVFHHKTRKIKFKILPILFLIAQIYLVYRYLLKI